MNTRVHARFFRVSKVPDGAKDFPELLLEIIGLPKPGDREVDIGDDLTLRLERCVSNGDYLEGEFCRVQKANIPPISLQDGLKPMKLEGDGIGHVAAFLYDRKTRVLLLQRNLSSATANRIALYIAASKPGSIFGLQPVMSKDAMARLKDKKPRGFVVTFAGLEKLDALDDAGLAAARGAKLIAEAYHGIRVKIEVSVGRSKKRWLGKEEVLEDVGALIDADGVRSLKVKAEKDGENDIINFLKEQLQHAESILLPEGDPDGNYEVRKLFLRSAFGAKDGELKKQFG